METIDKIFFLILMLIGYIMGLWVGLNSVSEETTNKDIEIEALRDTIDYYKRKDKIENGNML